jgi:hypothetical protein
MIENCWDVSRKHRMTALECCITLRECQYILTDMEYDIYISYMYESRYKTLINRIRNHLIDKGFKVAWMHDVTTKGLGLNVSEEFNHRYNLIQHSKVVLACLEVAYQTDWNCILELGNNRGFKRNYHVQLFHCF